MGRLMPKKEDTVATITFEPGNPTPTDVYVRGEGYETDRIVYVAVTKPDNSLEELTTGVLTDGGVIGYRYKLSGPGTYHFEHSQRRHLRGRNDSLELKAEADFLSV